MQGTYENNEISKVIHFEKSGQCIHSLTQTTETRDETGDETSKHKNNTRIRLGLQRDKQSIKQVLCALLSDI